ncbi:MAG: bifunctional riboflavin kinase/FAD synthetase [Dehalococcoidales bacterium]|nr:bifunctional riboflavin kinase/FAD synthetase [Dehalococcoidales bacterium]
MQIEKELAGFSPEKDMVLTIGVFDGVHLGHQYLISQLKDFARQQDLLSGLVTFRQHPQDVLSPQIRLPFLTDITERIDLLKGEDVENIIVLSFTSELAQLSARQFVSLLKKYLKMRALVVGSDFTLGQNREGDINNLRILGQDMDFTVIAPKPLMINGEVVSSTAIRNALANGDMKKVLDLAGRPFRLNGCVVSGIGRGTKLGFPTANLDIALGRAIPPDGVYTAWAYIGEKTYQSVANIGKCPTFNGNQRTVEVHILDYHGDLYGQNLKIDIIERLRGEKKFETANELKKQIADDVKQGKAKLNYRGIS